MFVIITLRCSEYEVYGDIHHTLNVLHSINEFGLTTSLVFALTTSGV